MSVDAVQLRLIWEEDPAVAERLVGTVGAVVSAGCHPWTVIVPPLLETATEVPSAKDPSALPAEMGTDAPLVAGASELWT